MLQTKFKDHTSDEKGAEKAITKATFGSPDVNCEAKRIVRV